MSRFRRRIRSALEICFEFAGVFFFIWILDPSPAPGWVKQAFFWTWCVGFPILCVALEQDYFPEFSLDWKQLLKCLRWVIWFTLGGTLFLVGLALVKESFHYDGQLPRRLCEYYFWAFLQQIGLQTFLTRRMEGAVRNPPLSAFLSATLFAFLHFPNPALMAFTWVGGFVWALSFQAAPNLFALAASHGWLAVVALYCVPPVWLHGLRVGPSYWRF